MTTIRRSIYIFRCAPQFDVARCFEVFDAPDTATESSIARTHHDRAATLTLHQPMNSRPPRRRTA